jgi:hypothetical protein
MNFPNSPFRHVLFPIRLIFGRVPDIPKCLANHGNNGRFVDSKFSRRANVQGELCPRPSKNSRANLTPLRFRRYFTDDDSWFIAGGISEGDR